MHQDTTDIELFVHGYGAPLSIYANLAGNGNIMGKWNFPDIENK